MGLVIVIALLCISLAINGYLLARTHASAGTMGPADPAVLSVDTLGDALAMDARARERLREVGGFARIRSERWEAERGRILVELLAAATAEPQDLTRVTELLEQLRDLDGAHHARLAERLVAYSATLTPDQRLRLAAALGTREPLAALGSIR